MAQTNFAMIHTEDQWRRAAFENTSLAVEQGVVQLAWEPEARRDGDPQGHAAPAGLVFDPWCRFYRSVPEQGEVFVSLWSPKGPQEASSLVFHTPSAHPVGDFEAADEAPTPLATPVGLAVDRRGHLFVAETGRNRVLVYDLVERRLVRRIPFCQPPVDLAGDGERVYALFADPAGLAGFDVHGRPRFETLPEVISRPSRLAVSPDGQRYVLHAGGLEQALIVPLSRPAEWLAVPHASHMAFLAADILVVARAPGQGFRRFRIQPGAQWELPHLTARHYDGRGIVHTPGGHIGFWTAQGFARATLARLRYQPQGRVTGFRLDSGQYQTVWGRIFIDACIPPGTHVGVQCLVLDEPPPDVELLPRTPPANTQAVTIHRPDLSPPMPPKGLVGDLATTQKIYRRDTGSETAWLCSQRQEGFETYEAPVIGPAGRFLWFVLELRGNVRQTPKIRSVRVEYPSHDLLRHLPQVYSRDPIAGDFLRRYLAIMEGGLREMDLRAMLRHILLDPSAAPQQVLDWLAGFIGLVTDERWPLAAKRQLIAKGVWLFRYRGTVMGLKRFMEIYLGREVVIIEHFKVRGLGGAVVGGTDALTSRSVLGAGFRVGGQVGSERETSVSEQSLEAAIETHAHRFSVIIPMSLNQEQQEVVAHILEIHRPCHTLYDICSVDAGMKVGISLYTQLTTMVGRSSGFGQIQVGGSLLGRQDVLGRPGPGTHIGGSHLGSDSRVG